MKIKFGQNLIKNLGLITGVVTTGLGLSVPVFAMHSSATVVQSRQVVAQNNTSTYGSVNDLLPLGTIAAPSGWAQRDTPPSDSASYGILSPNVDGPAASDLNLYDRNDNYNFALYNAPNLVPTIGYGGYYGQFGPYGTRGSSYGVR
uniref:Uncharacterized protein n=1 Tax=Cyanothece sp. (strain PCC 7425 / ATCC 29141) TaxID=395961 RepID=B8HME2_CYAP4